MKRLSPSASSAENSWRSDIRCARRRRRHSRWEHLSSLRCGLRSRPTWDAAAHVRCGGRVHGRARHTSLPKGARTRRHPGSTPPAMHPLGGHPGSLGRSSSAPPAGGSSRSSWPMAPYRSPGLSRRSNERSSYSVTSPMAFPISRWRPPTRGGDPMVGQGASLNVAVAGSLVLYRLAGMA